MVVESTDAFKKWQLSGEEQDHVQYNVKKKESKIAVAIAKENEHLYQKLDSKEGTYYQYIIYKLAKTRKRRTKHMNILTYHGKQWRSQRGTNGTGIARGGPRGP